MTDDQANPNGGRIDRYPIPGGTSNPHFAAIKEQIKKAIDDERQRCTDIALYVCGEYPANYNLQRTGGWVSASHAIEMAIRSGESPAKSVHQSLAGYVSLESLERYRCIAIIREMVSSGDWTSDLVIEAIMRGK